MAAKIKVTYATMSADNEELQSAYDAALSSVEAHELKAEVPLFIAGEKVLVEDKLEDRSPIDTGIHLCTAQQGTAEHARAAVAAAGGAMPAWRSIPWQRRVEVIRGVAARIADKALELSALMILEVGKSRLEALGEVEEAADLLRYYADSMERNRGFINELGKLNPNDAKERNFSVLHPHGAWVVISPFNFPMALSAAPIAAALLAGNTVVFKGSSETPYLGWKVAELFADADLPAGVFNYVSGPGGSVGRELMENPDVRGWTFTGSYEVGMGLYRAAAGGPRPRPAIVEMGGKNPTIVSRSADLAKAAKGVARAAFGMSGQKCSACSRVYVQRDVYEEFRAKLVEQTRGIVVADPRRRDAFMGTVINQGARDGYERYLEKARADGSVLVGGRVLRDGAYAKGYYVEPAIVEGLPEDHDLVRKELFLPILHLARVASLQEAMEKANDTVYGLTAGFFGEDEEEVRWFLDNIEAGTTYTNRASGATTGAWPGVQAFGGWKGSGSSGKGIGGLYSLALYMREQSRTMLG